MTFIKHLYGNPPIGYVVQYETLSDGQETIMVNEKPNANSGNYFLESDLKKITQVIKKNKLNYTPIALATLGDKLKINPNHPIDAKCGEKNCIDLLSRMAKEKHLIFEKKDAGTIMCKNNPFFYLKCHFL